MSEPIEQNQGSDIKDEIEANYQESISKLKECQSSKGFSSCFSCEEVLNCEIRQCYVKNVYTRLNRGKEGGFEF